MSNDNNNVVELPVFLPEPKTQFAAWEIESIIESTVEQTECTVRARRHMNADRPLAAHCWRALANIHRAHVDNLRELDNTDSNAAATNAYLCASHYADKYSNFEWGIK